MKKKYYNLIIIVFGLVFLFSGCVPAKVKTPKENLLEWAEKSNILAILKNKDDLLVIKKLTIKGYPPNIVEIPKEIELLQNLEVLYFDAVINKISPSIGELKKLKKLTLKVYNTKELPKEISLLQNLESLTFSSNILTSLPKEIGGLTNLRILNLDDCLKLSNLPQEISYLSNLRSLSISNSDFKVFPSPILELSKLENLNFKGNEIKEIPENIGHLKEVRTINMSYNRIEKLPKSIGKLNKLQSLLLDYNELSHLPISIKNIKYSLKKLKLSGNNFSNQEIKKITELLH